MRVWTISWQLGTRADELGRSLARELDIALFDDELVRPLRLAASSTRTPSATWNGTCPGRTSNGASHLPSTTVALPSRRRNSNDHG